MGLRLGFWRDQFKDYTIDYGTFAFDPNDWPNVPRVTPTGGRPWARLDDRHWVDLKKKNLNHVKIRSNTSKKAIEKALY